MGRSYKRGDTPQSGPRGERFAVDRSAVYPMREDPRSADYPVESLVRVQMVEFNTAYSDLLRGLHRAFNGDPSHLSGLVDVMFELKELARALVQLPSGDGATTAGPSFECVPRP